MALDIVDGILFTDQYQLTIAQLYFRRGLHEQRAQFDYFFRTNPDYGRHQAGYVVTAGLKWLLEWMGEARFGSAELERLRAQKFASGQRVFDDDFLDWLSDSGGFDQIEIDAVAEGCVVHPHLPIAIVRGPLAMAQILESSLLNHLNYPSLIATKV